MGILNWRLWDRLDDLDRRVGIRPLEAQGSARSVKTVVAVLMALGLLNLVERDWNGAIFNGVLAVLLGLFWIRRLRTTRGRLESNDDKPS